MTSAHSAAARHLRVVEEAARDHTAAPLVGYLVLVPEGTDPTGIVTADGTSAEFRPLPTGAELPLQHAQSVRPAQPAHPATAAQKARPVPDAPAGTGLHVDPQRHTAELDGAPLSLTYLEFELLAHFVAHPHHVHTRDHLVATLWGYSHIGDGRTVDVHIARLRRKLGPQYRRRIVTVRRVGYKYEPGRAG